MSNHFSYEPKLYISGFSPSEGVTGSTFKISGSGISSTLGLYFVDAFGGHIDVPFESDTFNGTHTITGTVPNVSVCDEDLIVRAKNNSSTADKCCFNIRRSGCIHYCNVEITGSLKIGGVDSNPVTTGFLAITDAGQVVKRQGVEYETGVNTSFFAYTTGIGDEDNSVIGASASAVVQFDRTYWNAEENFNTGNYRFEVEEDNRYLLNARVQLDSYQSSMFTYELELRKNDEEVEKVFFQSNASDTEAFGEIIRIVEAESGDFFDVKVHNEDTVDISIMQTGTKTYLAGNILGRGGRGPAGPQGIQGIQGAQGIQGPSGASGEQGIQGPSGPSGVQGIQGIQGAQGVQGDEGPTGEIGMNWSGHWNPDFKYYERDGVYNSGSSYISLATGSGHSPSGVNDDQWDIVSSGATGPQGEQGLQGPSGERGVRGFSVGAAIQGVYSQWATEYVTTTRFSDSPHVGQGVEVGSATIYPTNPGHLLSMEVDLSFSATDYTEIMACLFKDSETTPRKAWLGHVYGVNMGSTLRLKYTVAAGNTLGQTWKLRIGGRQNSEQHGKVYLNRTKNNSNIFGDAATSSITIFELHPEQPPPGAP